MHGLDSKAERAESARVLSPAPPQSSLHNAETAAGTCLSLSGPLDRQTRGRTAGHCSTSVLTVCVEAGRATADEPQGNHDACPATRERSMVGVNSPARTEERAWGESIITCSSAAGASRLRDASIDGRRACRGDLYDAREAWQHPDTASGHATRQENCAAPPGSRTRASTVTESRHWRCPFLQGSRCLLLPGAAVPGDPVGSFSRPPVQPAHLPPFAGIHYCSSPILVI
jgi:hypothetical protein